MKKHLIYINLDGFGRYYYDVMCSRKRELPNMERLIKRGVFFEQAKTGIPSITCPMQIGIVSGCYSDETGNCDKYWDREANEIVLTRRGNRAQTIGEVLANEGRTFVSIQQFALEGKGAERGRKDRLYIEPGGDYKTRFSILTRLIRDGIIEEDGVQGKTVYEYSEFPEAVFLYVDDLDSVGHNPPGCYAATEEKRVENVCRVLEGIDKKLGEVMDCLAEKGLLESVYILLTTDHGMISYRGKSRMAELAGTLESWGYRTAVCSAGPVETEDFDILLTSHDIQCQLFFNRKQEAADDLLARIERLPFVEKVMAEEELSRRGVRKEYADILISPREGESFSLASLEADHLYATHDSLHEKCQHIFTAAAGPKLRVDYREKELVYNKDFIPTMASCLGWRLPENSNGRILTSILCKGEEGEAFEGGKRND